MRKKQTKIVATLSDLSYDPELIKKLYEHGMDVIRLNTAHQSVETTEKMIKVIRQLGLGIAILIDTKGPEIRTQECAQPIELKPKQIVNFQYGLPNAECTGEIIYVTYENFVKEIPVGTTILLDDGAIEFSVTGKTKDKLEAIVVHGGFLKRKKSVNVPGVSLKLPSLTAKDKDYLDLIIKHNIEFVAHSFVRNNNDVMDIKKVLDKNKCATKIIAKIENKEGVDNLASILQVADGIMVARGDLGIELPAEQIPSIQKKIISMCIEHAKPVITATQMLESMIHNPRATRAEISDVANAIFDGTDAVMLSGETAYGKYPVKAVETMCKIAQFTEQQRKPYRANMNLKWNNPVHKTLTQHAIQASAELPIKAILITTQSGATARLLSSYRSKLPTYAVTHSKQTALELNLSYGVEPVFLAKAHKSIEEFIEQATTHLINEKKINADDLVLVIGSNPGKKWGSGFIEIQRAKRNGQ